MATSSIDAETAVANLAASGNVGNIPLITYNWHPSTQLSNYLSAAEQVSKGVVGAEAKIIAVGDSTTLGFGGVANNYRPTVSYPADLAAFLSQDGFAAQDDNFLGQGNNDFTIPDSRINLLNGAAWGYPFVAGGPVITTTGTGQGFTFTIDAPQTYDRVDINYLDTGSGTLNVSVDGGPVLATLQLGNTGKMITQTVDLPFSSHSEVTVLTASGNPTYLEGVSFWNSQVPSIQVLNAGEGGAESTVVGDGVTPGSGEISSSAAIGANLALINFGINDILQGNLSAAQTTANIALMVTEFRANGTDPIIIIPQPISSPNYAAEIPVLRADIHNLADTMNVPVIDLSATYNNNWTALANAGLMSDYAHPNAKLYADIASGIVNLLTLNTIPAAPPSPPVINPPVVVPPPVVPTTPVTPTPGIPVAVGSGPNSILLEISEDAYNGDAQFTITVDGLQIGGTQTATASHSAQADQAFTVNGNFSNGQHVVVVDFLNDAYAGTPTTDRNLYVDSIKANGITTSTNAGLFSGGPVSFTVPAAAVPLPPTPVAPPAQSAVTLGSGPDTLALQISEDAYEGDAQFTISVNGTQIGGVQTATASHAVRAFQTYDILGSFSGTNSATLTFLNDKYDGSPSTDRNLYLIGSSINGAAVPNGILTEFSPGPQSFLFSGPALPSTGQGSSPVVLYLSEDAYQGDAQFIVSTDGQAASAPQTVTASHAAGASQAFSLGTLTPGAHDIAVSFINDLYAGTPSTDRNLYVTGINVNNVAVPNATASILGDWTSHFSINVP